MPTIKETLSHAGFDDITSNIYLLLLQKGELTVPEMQKTTDLSRASVYNAITELDSWKLIEHRKEGRNAYYRPSHPNNLDALAKQKKRDAQLFQNEIKETIESLVGTYNLTFHKPGVRFLEGMGGFKEVLWDSLTAKEEIYTIADLGEAIRIAPEMNKEYTQERERLGIKKKILILDDPDAKNFLDSEQTPHLEVRKVAKGSCPFKTSLQMYDNKVVYMTLDKHAPISMIIQDKNIYTLQRFMFEKLWEEST